MSSDDLDLRRRRITKAGLALRPTNGVTLTGVWSHLGPGVAESWRTYCSRLHFDRPFFARVRSILSTTGIGRERRCRR